MIYDESQDIVSFIREREKTAATPAFRGSNQYRMLWDAQLLVPELSALRVCNRGGQGYDHIYWPQDRDHVIGTGNELLYGCSPEGIYTVEDVLDREESHFSVDEFNLEQLYLEFFKHQS